nr:histone deacetylase 14 [Tanacetum cinerariifolium]
MRTDDQILPHIRWVPIGKSNCYLDVEKLESNPIYKIASAGCYKCQLDEQWFDLTKDTLTDALQITPVNENQAFTSPPSSDAPINFVNELGYPKLVRNLSNVILWGVVTRAHIDYAERIWEEFTQSIYTFIDDKRNLAQHTHRKKKATLIVIPKPVLGYLKFSAKGTKREFFGMPIPGSLITADVQEASNYQEYLAKVAKHQRYLASETWDDPDSPVPKPTKTARKPKLIAPKADLRSPDLVSKKRKPLSSLRSVDESVAEDVPTKEPQVDDEEADMQRALEESMKSMYDVSWVSLPLVFIKEPESEKYQPLSRCRERAKKRHDESSSLYDELGLTDIEEESKEDVPVL